jgi:hypothetical protein
MRNKCIWAFVLFTFLCVSTGAFSQGQPAFPAGADYVGRELYSECHREIRWKNRVFVNLSGDRVKNDSVNQVVLPNKN